jgi:hypothetical protein
MKKIASLFIGLLMTTFAYSQDKIEKQTTQAEQFSATSGTLIEKQFIDIGKVKGVAVQVMKFKDLNNGASKSALRFEYVYKSSYSSDTKIATLDLDEIDGLIKSINNLKTTVFSSTRNVYTEVTFTSRTGFKAGAYYDVDKAKWVTFVKLEKFDSNSQVFLTTEDFTTLLTLVEKANSIM